MHSALALVRKIGSPLVFITLTFNPKWSEVTSVASRPISFVVINLDRILLVARDFKLKAKALDGRLASPSLHAGTSS